MDSKQVQQTKRYSCKRMCVCVGSLHNGPHIIVFDEISVQSLVFFPLIRFHSLSIRPIYFKAACCIVYSNRTNSNMYCSICMHRHKGVLLYIVEKIPMRTAENRWECEHIQQQKWSFACIRRESKENTHRWRERQVITHTHTATHTHSHSDRHSLNTFRREFKQQKLRCSLSLRMPFVVVESKMDDSIIWLLLHK